MALLNENRTFFLLLETSARCAAVPMLQGGPTGAAGGGGAEGSGPSLCLLLAARLGGLLPGRPCMLTCGRHAPGA